MSSARHSLPAADAAWLHMDRPTNHMVVNAVLRFADPVDWAALQQRCRERIVDRFPRFSERVDEGRPGSAPGFVADPAFELADHFHRFAVPAPGDEAALQELLSDLVSAPLDRERPLWEVYELEGYRAGCALLVRMHHAIADGIALSRVLLSLADDAGDGGIDPVRPPETRRPTRVLTAPARLGGKAAFAGGTVAVQAARTLVHPSRVAEAARAGTAEARAALGLLAARPDPPSAVKGEGHVAHRVGWSPSVSLEAVKRAGHAQGATVNDVMITAVAGALGHRLRQGTEVAPREIRALVPFNLRALDQALPAELGNRFGLVLIDLPVGFRDPLLRLAAVQDRMGEIKRTHVAEVSYGMLEAIGHAPARLEAGVVDFFSAKGSLVLTNVPGPAQPVSVVGTPVESVLVWAPCSGSVGLSVSVFSYAGRVTVGVMSDAALVPDPQNVADDVMREMAALGRAARAARS